MAEIDPYRAPVAELVDVPTSEDKPLAGRGTRLAAHLLDSLIMVGPAIAGGIAVAMLSNEIRGGEADNILVIFGFALSAYVIVMLIVNAILLHRHGQTLGKRIMKIRITRDDGSAVSVLRVFFLRFLPVTLLGAIPTLGLIFRLLDPLMIFQTNRRCLHDLIAGTIVVKA